MGPEYKPGRDGHRIHTERDTDTCQAISVVYQLDALRCHSGVMDITRVAQAMTDAADAEIRPRFRALAAGDIALKGPNDYVTEADKQAGGHSRSA